MNQYYEPWTEYAACRRTDPDIFFPEQGGGSRYDAKKVCARCPVQPQCLDKAMRAEVGLGHGSRVGIWGGLSPTDRSKHEPQWLAEQEESTAA